MCSGRSKDPKKHDLGEILGWPSELHQGVEGHQGLPQGCVGNSVHDYLVRPLSEGIK